MSQIFLRRCRKKEGKGKTLMPTDARACLLACPSRSEIHILAVHSALFQLELADPLRLNSIPLKIRSAFYPSPFPYCTYMLHLHLSHHDEWLPEACFDSDGGILQTAERSRKKRFSNGRIRENHSALTDACILHLQLATPCTRAFVVFRLFVIYCCHAVVRPRSSCRPSDNTGVLQN